MYRAHMQVQGPQRQSLMGRISDGCNHARRDHLGGGQSQGERAGGREESLRDISLRQPCHIGPVPLDSGISLGFFFFSASFSPSRFLVVGTVPPLISSVILRPPFP